MDLKQLSYFAAVAEEGSITAAAKKLHIAQPPLSHQMKLLEQELGVILMKRGPRRITLTDAGKLLYSRAQNLLDLAGTTERELRSLKSEGETLRLGTVSSSGAVLLEKRMIALHEGYPHIHFEIYEGNTYQLLELLEAGVIEAAVVRTPFQSERLGCIYLSEEPMVAVMKPDLDPAPGVKVLPVESLFGRPLICYRRFEKIIASACAEHGFAPRVFCKNDDARTTLLWASAGLGIGIVPRSACAIFPGLALTVKEIDCAEMRTRVAAIWRKDRPVTAAVRNFLKVFETC